MPDGNSLFAEVDEPSENDGRVGLGLNPTEMATKAQKTFEQALENVQPVASIIIGKLRQLDQPADEVEVKFGIKLTAEAGAVIAMAGGEVNYEITLKWKQDKA
ncbi:CU044_2847 family protein [Leptothoe sp. PORK10 BA2]|uniref:CU044_2847 family protein n=1 Tax=Leptothoe sp. PORK10 BA2 TaxID=3110254 RepID=UPI002B21B482|nr:CU044_2847 family protein [Leptothoe sp. PORK10 BA2]MEA5464982.1 CU044_2847 family protein [Leptothoe sp. PORK10 BA2]